MERTKELVGIKSFTFMKIQLLVKETSLTKAPADGILMLAQPFQHSIRLCGKQSAVFRW